MKGSSRRAGPHTCALGWAEAHRKRCALARSLARWERWRMQGDSSSSGREELQGDVRGERLAARALVRRHASTAGSGAGERSLSRDLPSSRMSERCVAHWTSRAEWLDRHSTRVQRTSPCSSPAGAAVHCAAFGNENGERERRTRTENENGERERDRERERRRWTAIDELKSSGAHRGCREAVSSSCHAGGAGRVWRDTAGCALPATRFPKSSRIRGKSWPGRWHRTC